DSTRRCAGADGESLGSGGGAGGPLCSSRNAKGSLSFGFIVQLRRRFAARRETAKPTTLAPAMQNKIKPEGSGTGVRGKACVWPLGLMPNPVIRPLLLIACAEVRVQLAPEESRS